MDDAIGAAGGAGRAAGRRQTIIVMAVTIIAIAGASWFLTNGFDDGVTSIDLGAGLAAVPPTVGQPPTGFSGLGYDGKPISLADYAGKPVWLNFGASWCRDCRIEAADLEATYEKLKGDGLVVLGVFISEPATDIASYVQRAGLTFPIVADQAAKVAGAYRIVGIPTHVFIGRDGLIRLVKIGALSKDQMESAVAAILR
jgi:peroxiredoxin